MRGHRYPVAIRLQAIALRREGRSLLEISQALGIPKNTLSMWVRAVPLSEAQKAQLQEKWRIAAARGRPLAVEAWRKKVAVWKSGIEQDVSHLGMLPFTDAAIGKLACGLLYVCEGGRYPASRQLSFANSDPRMIVMFLRLLRDHFSINEHKLRVRVTHRWDQDGGALKQFWSHVTGIPVTQFFPAYADARTKGQKTQRPDYRGVCVIGYCSTTLQYQLQAIGESVMHAAASHELRRVGDATIVAERPAPRYQMKIGGAGGARTLGLVDAIDALCPTELLPQTSTNYSTVFPTVSTKGRCG